MNTVYTLCKNANSNLVALAARSTTSPGYNKGYAAFQVKADLTGGNTFTLTLRGRVDQSANWCRVDVPITEADVRFAGNTTEKTLVISCPLFCDVSVTLTVTGGTPAVSVWFDAS